eukprot:comp22817_c0_seq1/m.35826 comp22817_c0_seq1/g.35826  ORF comp22817_c0_seq1/g.35826 comp22817_c0_seq1/m.35826 type:complete len:342 (-) comp22817_c0_seq1:736-1761(-)
MVTATESEAQAASSIPRLSGAEAFERLQKTAAQHLSTPPRAFFSTVLGGITIDLGAMVVPLDDHLVHRGHSVFDTCLVYNYRAYQLDPHLDRLLVSAKKAGINCTISREQLRQYILAVAAAAGQKNSFIRYWLSVGRGGFGVAPSECKAGGSQFYCVAHDVVLDNTEKYSKGTSVKTTTVPIKPGMFATVKSTNYLPNAMMTGEAEDNGAAQGIWIDERGMVAESAVANVAFVIEDGVLTVPKFDKTLAGVTVRRVLELAVSKNVVKRVEQRDITVEEAKGAKEAMLIGSTTSGLAIVEWDGKPVGDGKPGPVAHGIRGLLVQDRIDGEGQITEIPGLTPA